MQPGIFKEKDFYSPLPAEGLPETLEGRAEASSNIALIKYWGKKGLQLPMNTSLSFLLPSARTRTRARARLLEPNENFGFDFYLNERPFPSFKPKIEKFFSRIAPYVPFVKKYFWVIESENNFPHGAGIASSASGFAALARLLINLESRLLNREYSERVRAKTSFIARLGSGSASRSIARRLAVWGRHPMIPGSNDWYAVEFPFEIHPVFSDMRDMILLLQTDEKAVSSSRGHALLEKHPFKVRRIEQAQENAGRMVNALRQGDWETFGKITESEALSLHALMMTSEPYYILMQPSTLEWIRRIWQIREEKHWPVWFSLDAGANLHLIFPGRITASLRQHYPELFEVPHIMNKI